MITFVTSNQHKLAEARQILNQPIEALSLPIDEVQTLDPIECAKKKAQSAFTLAKKAILVEDTALFFLAWQKLPGVFVDYFLKTLGKEGLLRLLANEENRRALAQTTYCFYDGQNYTFGIGQVHGRIASEILGDSGFGFDAIFIPEGFEETFAQMGKEQKNKISMRKLALEDLKSKLSLDL